MKRLKRYNPVLEAVVTYTEELAYKQAKEADELLAKGVYLVEYGKVVLVECVRVMEITSSEMG